MIAAMKRLFLLALESLDLGDTELVMF